jgi:hypothetical protein
MRWVGDLARKGARRCNNILIGIESLGDACIDRRIILKLFVEKICQLD